MAEPSFGYSGHEVGPSAFVEQAGELEFAGGVGEAAFGQIG